ncbi:MAG: crossover junction endodeoxyribonuclease RuvC [Coriobacteriia bacterium]|nr:crossover junction endodeoxyribonuclease RuvC [Coriobacteriia bacterium]
MIILGIDPGLANTGWGVVERAGDRFGCLGYGCLVTDTAAGLAERLRALHDGLAELLHEHAPDECAVENVYFSANARTAFATGQARGAALVAVASAGVPVGEYGPGEVKLAVTGTGSADKRQVAYMVRAILGLAEEPRPDHAADALAIAVCHANGRAGTARRGAAGARQSAAGRAGRGWAAAVERAESKAAGGGR